MRSASQIEDFLLLRRMSGYGHDDMSFTKYGSTESRRTSIMHAIKERDLKRDRWLSFFIATTMLLLIILVIMAIIQMSGRCPQRRSMQSVVEDIQEAERYPSVMGSVEDFEHYCEIHMTQDAYLYFSGGSMTEATKKMNKVAFTKINLKPRHLVDVTDVGNHLSLEVFGDRVGMPIGISPTAYHKWAHSDGECATARAAQDMSVVYIASIHSNTAMEDIRKAAPKAVIWQQTYIFANRTLTKEFSDRAKLAGSSAIVLTIDKASDGTSWNRKRGLYRWPADLKIANFVDSKNSKYSPNITWEDVREFIRNTELPVVLKGVTSIEEAAMAVEVGTKGVLVSNHGGRALDYVPATINIVEDIVQTVEGKIEVFLDGGVRTGPDVFKALAKGAKMVFVGRPVPFGLGYNGEDGVRDIFNIFRDELVNTMQLSGTPTLANITKDFLEYSTQEIRS